MRTARTHPAGRNPSNTRGTQDGFALLEAIVALVLLGLTISSAYTWVNTNLITVRRLQAVASKTEATNNILAYLQNVNPMTTPSGEQAFEGYSIRWSSEAATSPRPNVNGPRGQGFYRVALYRINVAVTRPDGSAWFTRHWHQIGYRQVANSKQFMK